MAINQLNVDQICSIRIYINYFNNNYEYREEKRYEKGGFYYNAALNSRHMTIEEIESEKIYFCRDKRVYYKPHIVFSMSNGNKHEKYFESEERLKAFLENDSIKSIKRIEIDN